MIVGIDPSSSDYTGWAAVSPNSRLPLRERIITFGSIRCTDRTAFSAALRIEEELQRYQDGIERVCIERAPASFRGDAGHGKQAEIGWVQGYTAGVIATVLCRDEPIEAPVSAWRKHMQVLAGREGLPLHTPTGTVAPSFDRASVGRSEIKGMKAVGGGKLRITYKCGHEGICPNLDNLSTDLWQRCQTCRKDTAPHKTVPGRYELVRDGWKANACAFVQRFAPDPYAVLVEQARGRAKRQGLKDHELSGVPDACEAVGIALYGVHCLDTAG